MRLPQVQILVDLTDSILLVTDGTALMWNEVKRGGKQLVENNTQ